MSTLANPFLKDYSSTSLLKLNYGVLQLNSQIKQKQNNSYENKQQNKNNMKKENKYMPRIDNPFCRQSNILGINSRVRDKQNLFNGYSEYQANNQNDRWNSRSLSQSRKINFNQFGKKDFTYLNKNTFYKGLQDIGSRQLWKNQLEKQAKLKIKHFGVDSLKYQYLSYQKSNQNRQNKVETPSFKNHIASQYYGYSSDSVKESYYPKIKSYQNDYKIQINHNKVSFDDFQAVKDEEDFLIPRSNTKKGSLKKYGNQKHKISNNKQSNFQDIPQDRNQDICTMHKVQVESMQSYLQSLTKNNKKTQQLKRSSIQSYQNNNFPQSSASSGFGTSLQMYESGANFRFKSKGGPLNPLTFDDDNKNSELEQKQKDQQSVNQRIFPQTIDYNHKIYYRIEI